MGRQNPGLPRVQKKAIFRFGDSIGNIFFEAHSFKCLGGKEQKLVLHLLIFVCSEINM